MLCMSAIFIALAKPVDPKEECARQPTAHLVRPAVPQKSAPVNQAKLLTGAEAFNLYLNLSLKLSHRMITGVNCVTKLLNISPSASTKCGSSNRKRSTSLSTVPRPTLPNSLRKRAYTVKAF